MMFACGPFCSGCSSLLRVEACQRCARAQAATDAERFFDALEKCARHGGSHCEHGVTLHACQVPHSLLPTDVQHLAAICARRYPRGILVFHLAERSCCLIQRGAEPALVELDDAIEHLITPPSLAFVVLGSGRGGGIAGRIARVSVRDVYAHTQLMLKAHPETPSHSSRLRHDDRAQALLDGCCRT